MALASSSIGTQATGALEQRTEEATIQRIGSDIKDGRTFYYFSKESLPA
jgi:hypothetical protein